MAGTQGSDEQGVLSGLAAALESRFELARRGVDDQDGHVGLRRPKYHVRDEIFVAGRVQQDDCFILRFELRLAHIHRDTT